MEKSKERTCLNILQEVLKDAPISHYCIGGEMEGAVCLTNENDWTVFTLERGQKYDPVSFTNIVEAGIALLRLVFMLDEPDKHVNMFVNGIIK